MKTWAFKHLVEEPHSPYSRWTSLEIVQQTVERLEEKARVWETQATNMQAVNAERCAEVERLKRQVKQWNGRYEAAQALCNGFAEESGELHAKIADLQAQLTAAQADNRTYIDERHENMKAIESLQQQVAQLREGEKVYQETLKKAYALQNEHTTLRGLVEQANYELAALFPVPDRPTFENAFTVCGNKNTADARCILNAYEAIHEAATLPREGVTSHGGEHE